MVVAIAIVILPSLYAWLNIYSNWDPYGNTGGISIAVASLDEDYTTPEGETVNKGRDVLDDLRESTSINWVVVDTQDEAVEGVRAGDYYAAVVIGEDFTYNMYNMLTQWTGKPTITYYENDKKNAVATKITDTAASNLKQSITENYLEVLIGNIFRDASDLSQALQSHNAVQIASTDGGRSCRLGAGSADAGEHAAALAEPDAAGVCQRRRGRWHGQCPLAGGFGSRLVHEQPHSLDRGSDSYRQPDQPRDLRGAAEGGLRPAAGVSGAGDGRERWEQRGGACRRRPRPLRRRAGAGQGRTGRLRLGPPL